jgi:anti-sigma factor RsiW
VTDRPVAETVDSTEGITGPVSHVDDCKKFIACLSEHFDGELPQELEAEFMLHYKTCERARTIVRTFERTIILHRQTRRSSLPRDVHERLMAAIKACQGCDDES